MIISTLKSLPWKAGGYLEADTQNYLPIASFMSLLSYCRCWTLSEALFPDDGGQCKVLLQFMKWIICKSLDLLPPFLPSPCRAHLQPKCSRQKMCHSRLEHVQLLFKQVAASLIEMLIGVNSTGWVIWLIIRISEGKLKWRPQCVRQSTLRNCLC